MAFRSLDRFPSYHQFHDLYVAARGPVIPINSEVTIGAVTHPEQAKSNLARLRDLLQGAVKTVDDG